MRNDTEGRPAKRARIGVTALIAMALGTAAGTMVLRTLDARWSRSRRSPAPGDTSSTSSDDSLDGAMAKRKQAAQSADSAAVYLRLDHAELERLDAFAATLDGDVSRAEAARRLIVQGLDGGPALPEKPRFAPGDRVTTNRYGSGLVTEGPIQSIHYAVAFENATDTPVRVNQSGLRPA